MSRDRMFERTYSLNVARLGPGPHQEEYTLDASFFAHFDQSPIEKAEVKVVLDLYRYPGHIDAQFVLSGEVEVSCDRCGEPYLQSVDGASFRIFFSFEEGKEFDDEEVIYVERDEAQLLLTQELYDFVNLALPIRKVPEPQVHTCDPKVLDLLGLDAEGNPLNGEDDIDEEYESEDTDTDEDEDDGVIDPRWAALKNLKDRLN